MSSLGLLFIKLGRLRKNIDHFLLYFTFLAISTLLHLPLTYTVLLSHFYFRYFCWLQCSVTYLKCLD